MKIKTRIKNDPSFERTRENMAELTEASKASRLIRHCFRSLILRTSSGNKLVPRMQKELMKVLKTDLTNNRGARQVSKEDLSMLKGFEFSSKSSLNAVLFSRFTQTVERIAGKLSIKFPAFIPSTQLSSPITATRFRIVTAVAEDGIVHEARTQIFALQHDEITIPGLENQITVNTRKAILWVLCLEFYQEKNGKMYLLKDGFLSHLKMIHAESGIA